MATVEDELAKRRTAAGDEGENDGEPADGVETGAEPLGEGADYGEGGDDAGSGPEAPAPSIAEIRLMGGSLPIEGSFAKGTELDLLVRVRVSEVHGVDILDGWGNTKHTIRRHRARLISVQRANR